MRRPVIALVLLTTLLGAACGGRSPSPSAPRADSRVITREQMLERHFLTAMEAVQALRGNWLVPKGPDSFSLPSQLWVYYDNVRLGNANSLRTISTRDIAYLRYFNGVEATARWGIGHGAGVILASSWPAGEPPEREPEAVVVAVVDSSDRIFDVAGSGRFALSTGGRSAPFVVSAGDHAGVLRAAEDLRRDIGTVSSVTPELIRELQPRAADIVLVGTLGRSPLIDGLVQAG
jgi:hypothetical protein